MDIRSWPLSRKIGAVLLPFVLLFQLIQLPVLHVGESGLQVFKIVSERDPVHRKEAMGFFTVIAFDHAMGTLTFGAIGSTPRMTAGFSTSDDLSYGQQLGAAGGRLAGALIGFVAWWGILYALLKKAGSKSATKKGV